MNYYIVSFLIFLIVVVGCSMLEVSDPNVHLGITPPNCVVCKSNDKVIPIVYGMPAKSLYEKAQRGEVLLGGCCVSSDSPKWYCKNCKRKWK